jgi:hypothetical protein
MKKKKNKELSPRWKEQKRKNTELVFKYKEQRAELSSLVTAIPSLLYIEKRKQPLKNFKEEQTQ